MSILIKGMEMPTSCDECVFLEQWRGEVAYCGILNSQIPCECPLVPVPPHGDLIDRDPFIEFIKTHWDSYDQWFVEQLEARPTIIEAEEGE